jgi:hypothetical protein
VLLHFLGTRPEPKTLRLVLAALHDNSTGSNNTADGFQALSSNTSGDRNTATGWQALFSNTGANNNTAMAFNPCIAIQTAATILESALEHSKPAQLATATLPLELTPSQTSPVLETSR